ncbi:MAG TPA: response regulator [Chloroflexota bacterium]|nr:response regulator [Chloroflexota bacterium]
MNEEVVVILVEKARVLVVDDDPSIREMLSDFLAMEGYEVETAADGSEGLRAVEESSPSVIVLDMRMPVLDGWGFARELRERGIKLPILVVTAAQSPRRWAEEIGADGYLAKPFDLIDLLTAIERISPTPNGH